MDILTFIWQDDLLLGGDSGSKNRHSYDQVGEYGGNLGE